MFDRNSQRFASAKSGFSLCVGRGWRSLAFCYVFPVRDQQASSGRGAAHREGRTHRLFTPISPLVLSLSYTPRILHTVAAAIFSRSRFQLRIAQNKICFLVKKKTSSKRVRPKQVLTSCNCYLFIVGARYLKLVNILFIYRHTTTAWDDCMFFDSRWTWTSSARRAASSGAYPHARPLSNILEHSITFYSHLSRELLSSIESGSCARVDKRISRRIKRTRITPHYALSLRSLYVISTLFNTQIIVKMSRITIKQRRLFPTVHEVPSSGENHNHTKIKTRKRCT